MGLDSEIEKDAEKFWVDSVPSGFLYGFGLPNVEQAPIFEALYRKERILVVPIMHLMGILSGRGKVWFPKEIPLDSFPLRTFQDEGSHSLCIVVGHPLFTPVKEGFEIPRFVLAVTYSEATSSVERVEESSIIDEDKEREI